MSESTKKEFFTYFEQGVNNAKDKGVGISSVVVYKMYYYNYIFEVKRMLSSITRLSVWIK